MPAYYNENDADAARWLRNLIARGLIAPGDVDERSIAEVRAGDLSGYDQCHFFAGIGGWSRALRQAGWPDDRPVWTGSCPCQPFSVNGRGRGERDERHLWPEFRRLIAACAPGTIFGEQVASKQGRGWLDAVRRDLERISDWQRFYRAVAEAPHAEARGTLDAFLRSLCEAPDTSLDPASFDHDNNGRPLTATENAVHEQRRLAARFGEILAKTPRRDGSSGLRPDLATLGYAVGAADLCAAGAGAPHIRQRLWFVAHQPAFGRLADGGRQRCDRQRLLLRPSPAGRHALEDTEAAGHGEARSDAVTESPDGYWAGADRIRCHDGRWRPIESGSRQMADGLSRGLGLLRAAPGIGESLSQALAACAFSEHIERSLGAGAAPTALWHCLSERLGPAMALIALARTGLDRPRLCDRLCREARSHDPAALPQETFLDSLAERLHGVGQDPAIAPIIAELEGFTDSPLTREAPARHARLRGYGNAIVAPLGAEFIRAWMDIG